MDRRTHRWVEARRCSLRGQSSETRRRGQSRFRPLRIRPLEDRCLLSLGAPQLEMFSVSPALFVENQGQWADESIRYLHHGDGVNVAMTDQGPVFQAFRREVAETSSASDAPTAGLDPWSRGLDPDYTWTFAD